MKKIFSQLFKILKKNLSAVSAVILVCCFIITAVAGYNDYEKSRYLDYSNKMAQVISRQFSAIMSSGADANLKLSLIRDISASVLQSDKNFMSVQFVNKDGNVIVSEKSPDYNPENFDGIKISTAVTDSDTFETVGYIHYSVLKGYMNKKNILLLQPLLLICLCVFLLVFFLIKYKKNRDFELFVVKNAISDLLEGKFGTKLHYGGSDFMKEFVALFNELSSKLKEYEDKNADNSLLERNKFEAILMGISNGVVVCDNNDCIVLTNASAEKILSVSQELLINLPVQKYCDSNGLYPFKEKIEDFKDISLEIILKNPPEYTINIDDKIIKCVISPMFMQNEEYVGYIMVLTDITRETEVNNMKNQFISNVSHELRTPVTVLRTYLDTLSTMSDELDAETRKEFIETADKEVVRLHRMVNDILDVSRLESPDIEVEKEIEDIVPVLRDTITSMQVLAKEKSVVIDFEKMCEIPQIPFNKPTIERVFNNLLSNAIKYSPENGKICVKINLDGDFVDISVKDEGPGIEQKHLPKLFDRFYRAENNVHTVKGTGLGLYLVKTTVEKHHNGKVYVNSTVGEGSVFGIKLPVS